MALLTALHSVPIFMGDVMQIFVTSEWGLQKSEVVQLFSIVALTGVVANIAAATKALAWFGLRGFTALATASNLVFWASMSLDFKRALIGAVVGFLGPAKGIVSGASLASEGANLGMSQGQIAGDRANLFAILKVGKDMEMRRHRTNQGLNQRTSSELTCPFFSSDRSRAPFYSASFMSEARLRSCRRRRSCSMQSLH